MAVAEAFSSIELVIGETGLVGFDDERPEPTFADAPFFVEFGEPARLDPKRIGLTWELPPPRSGLRLRSSLGALLVHLLPFLLLITWPTATNEGPSVIPVQLVIVQPPPPAPVEPPQPQLKPPEHGRLASDDMGDVKPSNAGQAPTPAPPAPGEKQPTPSDAHTAKPPPPQPPPKPAQGEKPARPSAAQTAALAPVPPPQPTPKPAPPKEQAPVQLPKPSGVTAPKSTEPPHEDSHTARFAGPAATRDEYLAYLVTLTRQHLNLLPLSVVGTRRGETVISVVVQDNGTIAHIGISRSSGYPDIDQRIVQMVAAVQKFPPVPQWFQGNSMELELRLRFPEALAKD